MRALPRLGAAPLVNRRCCPCRIIVHVAAIAGVRCANAFGQVRTRHAKTVIPPAVNDHVISRHHMAIDTSGLPGRVAGVLDNREFRRQVALRTDVIGVGACDKPGRMWIVAIGAANARLVHSTLQERAVHIDLVECLPVGKVQAFVEQCWHVGVCERLAVFIL